MKKILFISIVILFISTGSSAQSSLNMQDKFFLGWEVAVPTNNLIKKTSWAGGRIEYRRMIKPNLSVGIGGSWNSFSEYVPRTTYQKEDGTGAVTTDLVKDIYTVPITLSTHYYFGGSTHVKPYVGIGLGTEYSDQTLYFNVFSQSENNWGFVARPEIGSIFPLNDYFGLYASAAYNYATNKNDIYKTNNLAQFAFSLGVVFSSR